MAIPIDGDFDHPDVGPVRYSYERSEVMRKTGGFLSDDMEPTGNWELAVEFEYMPTVPEYHVEGDRQRPVSRGFSFEFDEKPNVTYALLRDLFVPWVA